MITIKSQTIHRCYTSETRMIPLLIILAIPHLKKIYLQWTISGQIIQENMGKNIWIVITTGLQSRH